MNYLKDILDINDQIISDFQTNSNLAFSILQDNISKYDYLNHPRIIRCIIFLSNKDLDKLILNINQARIDPRDVMLFAEYINCEEGETPKRIRDFNKTFSECQYNVYE